MPQALSFFPAHNWEACKGRNLLQDRDKLQKSPFEWTTELCKENKMSENRIITYSLETKVGMIA
jgi:hypothetical protein